MINPDERTLKKVWKTKPIKGRPQISRRVCSLKPSDILNYCKLKEISLIQNVNDFKINFNQCDLLSTGE